MSKSIVYLLIALYECTTSVNQCELTLYDHAKSQNTEGTTEQPRHSKRSSLKNTKIIDRKRTNNAIENEAEEYPKTPSAGNKKRRKSTSADFRNINPDQADLFDSTGSVYAYNTFSQSCSMTPTRSQDDIAHITSIPMTSVNTFADMSPAICKQSKNDIQTKKKEPKSMHVQNTEEHIYNLLLNQLSTPQNSNAVHQNQIDTRNIIKSANFNLQFEYQLDSGATTINCDSHAHQYPEKCCNCDDFIDINEAEHILAKNFCPVPLSSHSSQNTTLNIKGGTSRLQNRPSVSIAQNSEKMTCPTTLTLSFLSFRLFETNKSSSADQNIDNGKEIDLAKTDGAPEPSCKEQQHNVSNFVYNCKINLDENEINLDITGLTRNQLYAIANDRQNGDKTTYVFAETTADTLNYFQNLLDFLEALDVSRYSCLNMQELYLSVIAYKCLEYNHNLKCFVLKDFLRWIHIYMSEFYYYVMLRLEKLNQGDIEAVKNIDEYKNYMKEEIKHIVTIIAIYTDINQLDANPKAFKTLIGKIYYRVEQFRLHILKFLESYHSTDIATSLYYLAVHMRNMKLANKPLNKNIDETQADKPNVSNHERLVKVAVKKDNHKSKRNDFRCAYYHRLHHAFMPKNMIYILAFTLSSGIKEDFKYNLKAIKNLRHDRKPALNCSAIFYLYVLGTVKFNKTIDDNVIIILQFLELVKSTFNVSKDKPQNYVEELEDSLCAIRPNSFKERNKTNYKARKLVLFSLSIQRAMGIRKVK